MQSYDAATALVVVDCQNDFADPGGSLYVRGGEDVVVAVNAEVVRALAAGAFVVYTQDWHPESTPHFAKDGGIWPVHCVGETWGAELHPRLLVAGPVVRKGAAGEDGYSGFTMRDPETGETTTTEMEDLLRRAGSTRVVVAGLALDYCVKATALDATGLGHPTRVPLGLTAAVDLEPGDGERAAAELRGAGVEVG
ncbi:MAG: isochorismatase family protein [Acidimicrobiia bacterium]|jgi:nicotinamidase/pyrazinamidase